MQVVPQTMPMSAFNKTPKLVVEAVRDAPVLVMNRSEAVGMLVHPEQWNRSAKRLAELEMFFEAIEASERIDRGETTTIGFDELCAQLEIDPHEMAKGGKP